MEIQKSFSKTAFGGFKKEEVTQYIDELITKYDGEVSILKSDLEYANAQITEFKSIVEQQYKRIVEITDQNTALTEDNAKLVAENANLAGNNANLTENNTRLAGENIQSRETIFQLEAKLRPFVEAKLQAEDILATAQQEAQTLSENMKKQLSQASEQAKLIFGQANEKAKSLIEPAQKKAEELINSAREEADSIILETREQREQLLNEVQDQIESTISLNEENEIKARQLVNAAQREAEEIIKRAKQNAEGEKGHYDKCLKELDAQKSKLLLSLDEIKSEVQAIQIMRMPRADADAFAAFRRSTTEAIRKKFTMLNKEQPFENHRD